MRKGLFSRYQLSIVSNLADVPIRCTCLLIFALKKVSLSDQSVGKITDNWTLENHPLSEAVLMTAHTSSPAHIQK